jgi:hypothetical protein
MRWRWLTSWKLKTGMRLAKRCIHIKVYEVECAADAFASTTQGMKKSQQVVQGAGDWQVCKFAVCKVTPDIDVISALV